MNPYFLSAGVLSFAITLIHIFAGGKAIAAPMVACEALHPVVRFTNYYCWHIVSICLALLTAAFVWPAWVAQAWEAGLLATVMATGFCILGIILVLAKKQRFRDMPQGWLFFPVGLLGLLGLCL